MKVLYLSYDGLTDPLGQSQILPYLKGLCHAGYQFHIISFEKAEPFRLNESDIRRSIEDFDITWHPQVYRKKPPIISTLLDLRQMLKVAVQLVKTHGIKMAHARSYPSGLIALALKKRYGIKFLFDIRGFWADERVEGGLWKLSNPIFRIIYNYFKRKEIEMMHGADHIVSLTHAGKAEIVSGNLFKGKAKGIDSERITVIPCAVDLELFDPKRIAEQDRQGLLAKLGLEKAKQILIYLGSLGTWYMLDEMLSYFQQYCTDHPDAKFLFVTKDDPVVILYACDRLVIPRDSIVIASASRSEVPLYLSIGTLGIFFIRPTYSKKASSATKMGEMLAMGLDFVCNEGVGDVDWLAQNSGATSLNVTPINGIDVLIVKAARTRSLSKFISLENGLENYRMVYQEVLKAHLLE